MATTRHIAFFRGINVGKAKRIAMADLRALFESEGFTDVKTILNSGNVVFTISGAARGIDQRIQESVERELGVASTTLVLSAKHLRIVLDENPLEGIATDDSRLLVALFPRPAQRKLLVELESGTWSPGAFALGSRAAYVWCPDGVLKSELSTRVQKLLKNEVTARNWRTLQRIEAAL